MGFIMNKDKSLNEMMLSLFNKSTIVDLSSETISESKSLSGRIYQDPEHNGDFELDLCIDRYLCSSVNYFFTR